MNTGESSRRQSASTTPEQPIGLIDRLMIVCTKSVMPEDLNPQMQLLRNRLNTKNAGLKMQDYLLKSKC